MSIQADTVLRVVSELIMPQTTVAQNVFYAKFLDDGGSNADQDVVDDCVDWMDQIFSDILTLVVSSIDAGECKVYQWDPVGLDWDEVGSNVMTVTFTDADQMLPHGVAAIITGRTVDPDVNGRKYFAGFGEDTCGSSNLSGAAITALLLAGAEWLVPFVGAATGSTFDSGVWSTTQVAFKKFVDNLIVNGVVGYQRRRKPGVGI